MDQGAVICPACRREGTLRNVDGLQGSENAVAIVLLCLFIIPGIAYYFDRTRLPWCSHCKKRRPKPL